MKRYYFELMLSVAISGCVSINSEPPAAWQPQVKTLGTDCSGLAGTYVNIGKRMGFNCADGNCDARLSTVLDGESGNNAHKIKPAPPYMAETIQIDVSSDAIKFGFTVNGKIAEVLAFDKSSSYACKQDGAHVDLYAGIPSEGPGAWSIAYEKRELILNRAEDGALVVRRFVPRLDMVLLLVPIPSAEGTWFRFTPLQSSTPAVHMDSAPAALRR